LKLGGLCGPRDRPLVWPELPIRLTKTRRRFRQNVVARERLFQFGDPLLGVFPFAAARMAIKIREIVAPHRGPQATRIKRIKRSESKGGLKNRGD